MTTSSDSRSPNAPNPKGEHWKELTAVLPERTMDQFSDWIDEQLSVLEAELSSFVTPLSRKSKHRR